MCLYYTNASNGMETWYNEKIIPDYQAMLMYQWCGPTYFVVDDGTSNKIYPEFFLLTRKSLNSFDKNGKPNWTQHLLSQSFNMNEFHNF